MKKRLGLVFFLLTAIVAIVSYSLFGSVDALNNFMNSLFGQTEEKETLPVSQVVVPNDGELCIYFIDVGQGDSVLLTSEEGSILVDTGDIDEETTGRIIAYLHTLNIERLDYLVLTHPDADHIGGAPEIISQFEIGNIIMPNYSKTTKIFERTMDAIEDAKQKDGTVVHMAKDGDLYTLGESLEMRLLAPIEDSYEDSNDYSVAMRVMYGKTAILLTGDAEKKSEQQMLKKYAAVEFQADLMKAGHHGSSTSNSEELLRAVDPDYIVISCGENNSYGHPHAEFMERAHSMGITTYRTDHEGTILFVSDGTTISKRALD